MHMKKIPEVTFVEQKDSWLSQMFIIVTLFPDMSIMQLRFQLHDNKYSLWEETRATTAKWPVHLIKDNEMMIPC